MKKKILALALCAVMALTLTVGAAGCSFRDVMDQFSEISSCLGAKGASYVGEWTLAKVGYEGISVDITNYTGEDISLRFNLTIREDGTASFNLDGEHYDGKWTETDNGILLTLGDEDEEMEFIRQKDGTLKLSYEGVDMIIKKTE